MSVRFEELDWRPTPMGVISLRRRWDPLFRKDVHEIKLDDDFLMSSLFTVAEVEMARLALAESSGPSGPSGTGLDVAVGGLGLGYTAQTVLEDPDVGSLVVVEALGEVIEWHERGLIPAGATLTADPRCRLVHGDFFAMVDSESGLDPEAADLRFHAVIVDIDHSPRHLLHPGHAGFYRPEGLRRLAGRLRPGGVFALWSNDPPDDDFTAVLAEVFADARAEVVAFPNPLQEREATNTVYLATTAPASMA
ncbi:spermidine synthase [Spinactinospora alkalitolerans]|uniref:Spermidine synthase n=1 Tax=Spinactinospora alkalitolerans TaxID=687207 RepID=A0A852U1S1_9ACTN|nr:spermidine synthase [Spinactinospora alkalitolerans]NYE50149.1 spermidine synthase [Spinactinospora alkalitolerans]